MQPIIDVLTAYGPGVVLFVIASVGIYKVFQGSIDGLKKSNEALGQTNSRFESEIKDIRAELKERREEAQEEREQSKKYRAEVKELGSAVSSLENQLEKQSSLIKKLLENVAELSKEVSSIKEQHSSSVDRIDDIASSIANFTHHLEHSSSVNPEVIEFFEEKLNEHNLELVRLKDMVEGMSPTAVSIHDAVLSVLEEDAEVVTPEDLEAVLHTMLDESED
ncbi:hypothetical protein [Reinekea blandensis]|uniref:Uncharacterized protein n=1 Tax=Reinekea blandensis MED297 TaxID=314283 RepID=A4BGG3_9GAMM|nr:hypothetical protein [Reinekea blandensis]EAR08769.1 hypothetical protein MED297_08896 [Reinekea sp. MED297] [Reinekea blandensis MED297]